MKFRTEIEPLKGNFPKIDFASKIALVGSCFTDEIGKCLVDNMFDATVNPFGSLFNPESMAIEIENCLNGVEFSDDDFFEVNGRLVPLRRKASSLNVTKGNLSAHIQAINEQDKRTRSRLLSADILFLTFGSAIAFRHIAKDFIVGNCQKLPAQEFNREELSVSQIVDRWTALISLLLEANPKMNIVLTVSPVRHIGYGLVADRLSKSTLCVACHELSRRFNHVSYFPSYEILVDDLRDYRFYANDLVHPSTVAVNYIFDFVKQTFMDKPTIDKANKLAKLAKVFEHRYEDLETIATMASKTLKAAKEIIGNDDELYDRFVRYCNSFSYSTT